MKSKFYCSIILLLLFFLVNEKANAQAPPWQWAHSAGDNADDLGKSIAVDKEGNIYVTGSFTSATITFGNFTLTNNGGTNIFIVKYDSSGNVIWTYCTACSDVAYSNGLALDNSGNIYITGLFTNTIVFGMDTLINAGIFINSFTAKFDNNGNAIWAKRFGGTLVDVSHAIAVNNKGNVLISGRWSSPQIILGNDTLINNYPNHCDAFIIEYDSMGIEVWKKASTGGIYPHDNQGNIISSDVNGNWYIAGQYESNNITIDSFSLCCSNNSDYLILKCDSAGNVLWVKSGHSDYYAAALCIATEENGNSVVAGFDIGDSLVIGNITLYQTGFFMAKYDSAGNLLWAKDAAYSWDAIGYGVALDSNRNIYATGTFNHIISFGTDTLICGWDYNIFVVKFDSSGNELWAKDAGGINDDFGNAIAIDEHGNAILSGRFNSPSITFGNNIFTNSGNNNSDFFVAKVFNNLSAGFFEPANFSSLVEIFPNPATNHLTISLKDPSKKANITITDLTGKIIYKTTATQIQKIEVNTKSFSEGIYIVQILREESVGQTGEFIETRKLVIAR